MNSSHDKNFKRPALGKGFTSLMALDGDEGFDGNDVGNVRVGKESVIFKVNVNDIEPNPRQPRKIFKDEALQSLSKSIKEDGVIQPIIITKNEKNKKYTMVAGERRWRASKLAGLTSIPAILKEASPETILRLALIENIQRADLNIIEEAEAYSALIKDFGLTQDQCAQKVSKDRSTITNALRLLSLPKEIQDDLMENRLTMGHGRALLTLIDKKLMLRARDIIIKKQLNVRKTEQLCKNFIKNEDAPVDPIEGGASGGEDNSDVEYLAETLRNRLRTKVKISGTGSKGKIEISFFSAAELERLMDLMGVDE